MTHRPVRTLEIAAAAALALAFTERDLYATIWDAGFGNTFTWSQPGNWSPDVEPTINDDVFFPTPVPKSFNVITLGNGEVARSLVFQDNYELDGGTLSIGGTGAVTTVAGVTAIINSVLQGGSGLLKGGPGTLILTGDNTYTGETSVAFGTLRLESGGGIGDFILSNALVGTNASLSGAAAVVTGAGSAWWADGFAVGLVAPGTLTVESGGSVNAVVSHIGSESGSEGTATVTGAGSMWNSSTQLEVGHRGSGSLTISAGGSASAPDNVIGFFPGSTGDVVVTDDGSTWTTTDSFAVGYQGQGTLEVQAGGAVVGVQSHIGSLAGSVGVATVTGSGSTWNNSGFLGVGYDGTGTLNILAGGDVSTASCFVGSNVGSVGHVVVDGAGSTWTVSPVIGEDGTATLTVSAGGSVVSDGPIQIGRGATGQGDATVTGAGSSISTTSDVQVGWVGDGTLLISGGASVSNTQSGLIALNEGSTGVVTVTGAGSTWTNGSEVSVGGGGTGTLNIEAGGDVTSATGRVGTGGGAAAPASNVNISGAGSSWVVSGELTIGQGGNGAVTLSNGATLSANTVLMGNSLDSNGAATVTGNGSTWTSPNLIVGSGGGSGTFTVQNGGDVVSQLGSIGNSFPPTSGAVIVTGAGSTWNNSNNMNIGWFGSTGTLSVLNGGAASAWIINLGGESGSTGTINVAGAGSLLTVMSAFAPGTGEINMGESGATAVLNITGGTVSLNGHLVDAGPGHTTLTLDGGTLDMKNHNIGGAKSIFDPPPIDVGPPIDVLNFRSGTLKNVKQINGGAGLTKTTSGTLLLDGTNTFSGVTTVSAGTLELKTRHITGSGAVIASGAVMRLLPSVTTPHNVVLKTGSITTNGSGKLDLTDNKLIVAAGSLGSWDGTSYTGISGLVDSGRGNAGNALWDGSGIVTSDTRAINTGDLCSLGVATAGAVSRTTFGGLSVAPNDVLVMFTWGGDANLDGKINIDDYGRIDGNVGQSGSVFGWFNGDFNYDGKINIDDYGIIDGNINRQGAAFFTGDGAGGAAGVGDVASVPEPAVLAGSVLAVFGATGGRARRGPR